MAISNSDLDLDNGRTVDLTAWGLKSANARDVYSTLQRLQYKFGWCIPYAAIMGAVLLSKRDIKNAIREIEASGLIIVDDAQAEIQLIR